MDFGIGQVLKHITALSPRCLGNGGHHQWVEHVLLTKGRLFSKAAWHIISLEWNLDKSPCPAVLHWLEDWIFMGHISQALLAKHCCDVVLVNLALLCISLYIYIYILAIDNLSSKYWWDNTLPLHHFTRAKPCWRIRFVYSVMRVIWGLKVQKDNRTDEDESVELPCQLWTAEK